MTARWASVLCGLVLLGLVAAGCSDPRWGEAYPLATVVFYSTLAVDEPAVFDASGSRDSGLLDHYTFRFGDASPVVVSRSPVVTHTYTAAGYYVVEVEVIDDLGNVAFERRDVRVVPADELAGYRCSGSCPGHLTCDGGRCRYQPAECRTSDDTYTCDGADVCCRGYCEPTCDG